MTALPPKVAAEQQERARRKARPVLCPKCGGPILVGPDADRAAIPAVIDPWHANRPARPGDYALHNGEIHYLDAVHPDTPVYARHRCPS